MTFLCAFSLALSLWTTPATSPASVEAKKPILEIVVYKVTDVAAKNIEVLVKQNQENLKAFPGFVSYKSTKSLEDPTVRVDYCEWATLEDANKAAEKVQTMKEFEEFNKSIAQVIYFGHLENF